MILYIYVIIIDILYYVITLHVDPVVNHHQIPSLQTPIWQFAAPRCSLSQRWRYE